MAEDNVSSIWIVVFFAPEAMILISASAELLSYIVQKLQIGV